MAEKKFYPDAITAMPLVDGLPSADMTAYLMQGVDTQVVFFELPAGAEVPPHSHGAQWGVVLDGRIELTIGDETKIRTKGDSYSIGDGEVHAAKVLTDAKVMDVFFEPGRYSPKAD